MVSNAHVHQLTVSLLSGMKNKDKTKLSSCNIKIQFLYFALRETVINAACSFEFITHVKEKEEVRQVLQCCS